MAFHSLPVEDNDGGPPIEISVVSPVFNEEEGISIFAASVAKVLDSITSAWEIVFVDDGSRDKSYEKLCELSKADSRIKVLRFSRNFGNQIATSAGLRYAQGQAVITMDADLQHPPELIPKMVQLWKEGYHSVYTTRTYGKETGIFKRRFSSLYAKTLNFFSDLDMPEGMSDFRLLDRRIVQYVNSMDENGRFLRAMIRWLGFREVGISFTANARSAGTTKFSPAKLIRLSIDGIAGFSVRPLRWITYSGLFVASLSLLYASYVLYEVAVKGILTPGWPTLIVAVLFLGGVQLISLGVVGEYIGRIYMESKRRPLFVLQEKRGFEHEKADFKLSHSGLVPFPSVFVAKPDETTADIKAPDVGDKADVA